MGRQSVKSVAGRLVRAVTRRLGYDVVRYEPAPEASRFVPPPFVPPVDCDEFTTALMHKVRPYTLTSPERIMALVEAVRYLVEHDIKGDLLECGVWRGGSVIVMADTLLSLGVTDRDLYLFDTFTHMPEPGEHDFDLQGVHVQEFYEQSLTGEAWRYMPYEQVVELVLSTGYPEERVHFVKGMVEDTIPERAPDQLAMCRLDTDWYESTAHEMRHLYPRIVSGGILLVDDYGHFRGSKKAVDEYFAQHDEPVLLNRIDYSGRLVVKP